MKATVVIQALKAGLSAQVFKAATAVGEFIKRRNFAEAVHAGDVKTLAMVKAMSDAVTIASELVIRQMGKATTDTVITAESVYFSQIKTREDAVAASDLLAKQMNKGFIDGSFANEVRVLHLSKVLVDVVGFTELMTRAMTRPMADAVTANEAIGKTLSKSFADTVTALDSVVVFPFTAANAADGVTLSEVRTFSLNRSLADPVGLLDWAAKSLARAVAEAVTASDTRVLTTGKARSDAVTAADAGAGFHLSYGLADYFGGDYVGTNFTF